MGHRTTQDAGTHFHEADAPVAAGRQRSGTTVTVLLPVFNGEKYVSQTIESVLTQSFEDFELLILDDGSNDHTPEILAECGRRDPRIRILRHENRGVAYSLNRGLAEARGALIAQIGADDLALPERLTHQVEFFERNRDYVLLGGYLRVIDSNDLLLGIRKYPIDDSAIRARMLLYNPFGAPAVMYRREEALAAGGFTSRFWTCEDYDFVLRIAKRGKIANLAEELVCYRLHAGAIKSTKTLEQLRDTLATKRAALAEYGYPQTVAVRAVNLAQEAMTHMPPAFTYWVFQRVAIR